MYWLFPFHKVPAGSRVVLYSGSTATKNYLKQIWETKYCDVVGVVTKHPEKANIRDTHIFPLDKLSELNYDYLLITPVREEVREEIKGELLARGVPERGMIFCDCEGIDWDHPDVGFRTQLEEYEACKDIPGYFEEIDPRTILTSRRMDDIVKYLLFRDFVAGADNPRHLSLYTKFIYHRTGGKEPESYWSLREQKDSVAEYILQGRKLFKSMYENGFRPDCFIPLDRRLRLHDGHHRFAAALALGMKIWVHQYDFPYLSDCGIAWFEEQGFSQEDKIRLLRGFVDLYPGRCGMFVLFAPYEKIWQRVERKIMAMFTVVGSADMKFPEGCRIVVVSDEEKIKGQFYEAICKLGQQIEKDLRRPADDSVSVRLQYSGNWKEYMRMKETFLSPDEPDFYAS